MLQQWKPFRQTHYMPWRQQNMADWCVRRVMESGYVHSTRTCSTFVVARSSVSVFSDCFDDSVWMLRGNIIRTALCWIVWHNVHSPQQTYMSSSYRSNRLGLSHWDPYAVGRGRCLELCYCNVAEWFWWNSSPILTTNWLPSVLWHCWFGHLACKNRPRNDLSCVECDVKPYTLTHTVSHKAVTLISRQNVQLVCAFVLCRLDYCNSLLFGVNVELTCRLQSVQKAAACLVAGVLRVNHLIPVLYWLPIHQWIRFKIARLRAVQVQDRHINPLRRIKAKWLHFKAFRAILV